MLKAGWPVPPSLPVPRPKGPRQLTVGSACSGWCSEIFALQYLGVAHQHIFACDVEASCKTLIQRAIKPVHFFDDITGDEPEAQLLPLRQLMRAPSVQQQGGLSWWAEVPERPFHGPLLLWLPLPGVVPGRARPRLQ